jgi:hypothetical protein
MKQTAVKFHFRATNIVDEAGKVIGKTSKPESKDLNLPALEVEDLLAIIENGGKGVELLLEAVNDVIYQEARNIIADAMEAKKEVTQELMDSNAAQFNWEVIANKPKAERRGHGISKEDWEAFAADYKEVMAIVQTDKTAEQIATAALHISKKFANCRFNKPVIATLRGYLATWFSNTPNKDDFATVYEALDNRAETLLTADEAGRLAEAI